MRVAQYVPGHHLILEVTSRSRGEPVLHRLLLKLNVDDLVESIICTCEGYRYRGGCHHLESLRDAAGAPARRRGETQPSIEQGPGPVLAARSVGGWTHDRASASDAPGGRNISGPREERKEGSEGVAVDSVCAR